MGKKPRKNPDTMTRPGETSQLDREESSPTLKASIEGRRAGLTGAQESDNPYPPGTDRWVCWRNGHYEATTGSRWNPPAGPVSEKVSPEVALEDIPPLDDSDIDF